MLFETGIRTVEPASDMRQSFVMLRNARITNVMAASPLGKCPPVLDDLSQTHVQTLNCVGGVNQLPDLRRNF